MGLWVYLIGVGVVSAVAFGVALGRVGEFEQVPETAEVAEEFEEVVIQYAQVSQAHPMPDRMRP